MSVYKNRLSFTKEAVEKTLNEEGSKAGAARKLNTTVKTINKCIKEFGIVFNRHPIYDDITNKKYGRLTAIYKTNELNGKGGTKWLCRCDCGKEKIINKTSLVSGLTKSCGCYKREKLRINHYMDISAGFWRRHTNHVRRNKFDYNITKEYVWSIYEKQGRKCALSGVEIKFTTDYNKIHLQTASIDRIDSSKGYIKGNIQLIHKTINVIKNCISQIEFIAFCNLIALTNKVKYKEAKEIVSKSNLRTLGYRSKNNTAE